MMRIIDLFLQDSDQHQEQSLYMSMQRTFVQFEAIIYIQIRMDKIDHSISKEFFNVRIDRITLLCVFMCCCNVCRRVKTFPHTLQMNLCESLCFTLV